MTKLSLISECSKLIDHDGRSVHDVLAALEYPGMKITSLSVVPAQAEIGATVTANLTVTLTKDPTAQSVNGAAVPNPVTARTLAVPNVTVTTVFQWSVTDADAPGGPASDNKSVTLAFLNKGHAGFIDKADAATLTAGEVNGMAASWFATPADRTINLVAGGDGFLWFVQPANQPDPAAFKVNGFNVVPVKSTHNHLPATPDAVATSYNFFRLSARLAAGAAVTLQVLV